MSKIHLQIFAHQRSIEWVQNNELNFLQTLKTDEMCSGCSSWPPFLSFEKRFMGNKCVQINLPSRLEYIYSTQTHNENIYVRDRNESGPMLCAALARDIQKDSADFHGAFTHPTLSSFWAKV